MQYRVNLKSKISQIEGLGWGSEKCQKNVAYYLNGPKYQHDQLKTVKLSSQQQLQLQDNLLSSVTIIGAYIYAIFSMIAAGVHLGSANPKSIAVFVQNTLLLIQVSCQGNSHI